MAIFVLAKYWRRVIFLPADVIVSEGDAIKCLYIVLRGRVGMSIKLQAGMRPLQLVDLEEGGFFGEECCRMAHMARVSHDEPAEPADADSAVDKEGVFTPRNATRGITQQPRYLSTVRSVGYSELLDVPAAAYSAVAEKFEEVVAALEPAFIKAERSRQVKLRWKKACAKVVLANRWNMTGNLYRGCIEEDKKEGGLGKVLTKSLTRAAGALARVATRSGTMASQGRVDRKALSRKSSDDRRKAERRMCEGRKRSIPGTPEPWELKLHNQIVSTGDANTARLKRWGEGAGPRSPSNMNE
jgi:hypothetical protein